MSDPHLRRAVWLTGGQRGRLREAVNDVLAKQGDHDLLPSLLAELILVDGRSERFDSLIRSVVRGLRMPRDTRPVHVCDAQVAELVSQGVLDDELIGLLAPRHERYQELEDEEGPR